MEKQEIKKSLEDLSKEEAIERLEYMIFIEQMADYMDFKFVEICEKLIKELKGEK